MLQNICFRLAAIPATVRAGSWVPPPNWKAAGRSAGTAGLWVGDKQSEELRDEAELNLEPEIRTYLCLHSALWFYSGGTKRSSVSHGCLRIAPAQRRLVEKKALMSSVNK